MSNHNKLIIFSGPSGVGKGSIIKKLFLIKELNLSFSISATTRKKRNSEIDQKDYYFISKEKFKSLIKQNKFLEYAIYEKNYYGTLISEIESKFLKNKNIVLDIDYRGKLQIDSSKFPQLSFFILPTKINDLSSRLLKRNSESKNEIKNRLKAGKKELEFKNKYQFIIVNDSIEETVLKIKKILLKNL